MSKKKKEKTVYVDDGRTVADMSGVSSGMRLNNRGFGRQNSSPKEIWKTYIGAVKMMFVPMLVVICALVIIYMLMSFFFLLM